MINNLLPLDLIKEDNFIDNNFNLQLSSFVTSRVCVQGKCLNLLNVCISLHCLFIILNNKLLLLDFQLICKVKIIKKKKVKKLNLTFGAAPTPKPVGFFCTVYQIYSWY